MEVFKEGSIGEARRNCPSAAPGLRLL